MLLLLACVSPDPAGPPAVDTADPLPGDPWPALVAEAVLHLGFDALVAPDGVLDDSPSGLAGIAHDEADVARRTVPGPRGDALTFDGLADFVYVADADALDLAGPFTLLAWMRADPRDGVRAWPLVDKYAYVDGAWTGYGAWLDGAQPYAGIYAGVETATECGGPGLGVFDDGRWHLYAAVFDGAALTVTVDADVAATCAWTLPATPNTDWLEVGTRGGSFFFAGALDEVTVLPRALGSDELVSIRDVAEIE